MAKRLEVLKAIRSSLPGKETKNLRFWVAFLSICVVVCASWLYTSWFAEHPRGLSSKRPFERPKEALRAARDEYFFNLVRDPSTNRIPTAIRARELAYSLELTETNLSQAKSNSAARFEWFEAGPSNIGGRTRALGIDVSDPNIVIAGGASGGIWKSTNLGASWVLKNEPNQNLNVSSLAQDPREGRTNIWYYASGEFRGISASDRGFRALFYGTGLYKSTNNGESWNRLLSTDDADPTSRDSPFDFISKVIVSPASGTVFLASNLYGIYRSDDYGQSFKRVLGSAEDFRYTDVAVASDGALLATLSVDAFDRAGGLFSSTDDGVSWTNITPAHFPPLHDRSLVAFAPSNPDIAYVLTTFRRQIDEDTSEDMNWFHKLILSSGQTEDRSANLPNFDHFGQIVTQRSYNMVLSVKPDDENFVVVGGTSLFRSRDGFATPSTTTKDETWIGGYPHNITSLASFANFELILYENHHPDQHAAIFDPSDPNTLWSGHDGGLSVTEDINAAPVSWRELKNGYNVTQFYTVAIPQAAGDRRIMGGTQDNGSPYLQWQQAQPEPGIHVGSGDGSYAYFGQQHAYVSSQRGRIRRLNYDGERNPIPSGLQETARIFAPTETGRLFIHPFAIDPRNEDVMYYPVAKRFGVRTN